MKSNVRYLGGGLYARLARLGNRPVIVVVFGDESRRGAAVAFDKEALGKLTEFGKEAEEAGKL